jgi:hypothetical protein
MCINAETSITTFIVASVINIIILNSTKNKDYIILAIIYQFIIFMQLFDFMAWIDQKCGLLNKIATKLSLMHTTLQPIFVSLICILLTDNKNLITTGLIMSVCMIYLAIIIHQLYYSKEPKPIDCMTSTEKCNHLQYKWWSNIGQYGIFYFMTPIALSFLLLLKSFNFALINVIYLIVSFGISLLFYGCGTPSIFCLFAVGGPILNYILMKNNI